LGKGEGRRWWGGAVRLELEISYAIDRHYGTAEKRSRGFIRNFSPSPLFLRKCHCPALVHCRSHVPKGPYAAQLQLA